MSLTFYYAPHSSAVRVHWALEELSVPYEKVKIDLRAGAQRSPEFLKTNPNGKVPALVIDGAPMFESLAILLELGERFGVEKGLWFRPGTAEHAEALSWATWGTVTLGQTLWRIFLNSGTWTPPESHNAHQLESATRELHDQLRILNDRLVGREYLVGRAFSIVDLANAAMLGWSLGMIKPDLTPYPHFSAWLGRCTGRPGFGAAMAP